MAGHELNIGWGGGGGVVGGGVEGVWGGGEVLGWREATGISVLQVCSVVCKVWNTVGSSSGVAWSPHSLCYTRGSPGDSPSVVCSGSLPRTCRTRWLS